MDRWKERRKWLGECCSPIPMMATWRSRVTRECSSPFDQLSALQLIRSVISLFYSWLSSWKGTSFQAQGQTFERVGVLLRNNVFSHGQLYVAMSRSRNWDRIKLYSEAKVEDIGTVVVNKVNHKVLRLLSQVCSQGTIASLNRIFSRRWMNVESGMKLFVS